MIAIVDLGLGNVASIANMLKRAGYAATTSANREVLEAADKLILPGVGAFDAGMRSIEERQLTDVLTRVVLDGGKPILGICLGMQLMTKGSEECSLPGLGWINARVVRFRRLEGLRVPHMGWNDVVPRKSSPLMDGLPPEPRFYFVHSFYVDDLGADNILATTTYDREFCSAFELRNIAGVQFHPEKSHRFGLTLLKAFAES